MFNYYVLDWTYLMNKLTRTTNNKVTTHHSVTLSTTKKESEKHQTFASH